MAQRRMFSNRIANSARFLQMPEGAQLLYFHMIQRADDDGVVESYPLIKLLGTAPDNFKVLIAKGFIRQLNEDQVIVIEDWLEHNTIRADRKVNSMYSHLLDEVAPDISRIEPKPRTDVIDNSKRVGGQSTVGIDKDRLGKDRLEQNSIVETKKSEAIASYTPKKEMEDFISLEEKQEEILEWVKTNGVPHDIARREIGKFMNYWLELDSQGKKQRWQKEKTFELKRRLATWCSRSAGFSKVKESKGINLDNL